MADLSKIKLKDTVYELKDSTARANMVTMNVTDTPIASATAIKVGSNTYSIDKTAVTESDTNGNVTVDGTDINVYTLPEAYKEYLDEVTYKKPSITSFSILNSSGTSVAGTYESGTTVNVSAIKHCESNIANINGNLTLGSIAVIPVSTTTTVDLATAEDVTTTTTYTLSGTDTKSNAFSSAATITFNRYAYSALTTNASPSTSGLTKQATITSFKSNGANFTYVTGQYLYMYLTTSGLQAQTNVLGQWTDVTSEEIGPITITLSNNTTASYYAYRIGPFIADGTAKYRVK